jgi:hypothetical protein
MGIGTLLIFAWVQRSLLVVRVDLTGFTLIFHFFSQFSKRVRLCSLSEATAGPALKTVLQYSQPMLLLMCRSLLAHQHLN